MFRSAEISVYIHPNYHRRGLGRLLVKEMNRIGKQMQFRAIYGKNNTFQSCVIAFWLVPNIAVITSENTPSIQLFKSLNYRHVGTFKDVGYKFGKWLDVDFWELIIEETQGPGDGVVPHFKHFQWGAYTFGQ